MRLRVIKLGGSGLDRPGFIDGLSTYLRELEAGAVVVHGGGPAVDDLQRRLGMEPVKVDGLRRSQPQELEAALMALCGAVNKRLVASLLAAGVPAVGLAGLDGGLLRVDKLMHPAIDLGFVGEVAEVRPAVLEALIERDLTPVVSPLSLGPGGQIYNVNADQVASALAGALAARSLDLVSDVPGVMVEGTVLAQLEPAQARSLLDGGRVNGGMVPKVLAALAAIEAGVPQARIVDLEGLATGDGTLFLPEAPLEGSGKGSSR